MRIVFLVEKFLLLLCDEKHVSERKREFREQNSKYATMYVEYPTSTLKNWWEYCNEYQMTKWWKNVFAHFD